MLKEVTRVENGTEPFRWWYAPSWLGLDSPCVVSVWTWAASRAMNVTLPFRVVAAMFLVVWLIYLLDRLVDVASCRDWMAATGRLTFGKNYRPLFSVCVGLCLVGLAGVVRVGLPRKVILRAGTVAIGVAIHFFVFVKPILFRSKLPGKEFGVGIFFALGVFACLGATVRSLPLLASIACVVTFACLVIAARDADSDRVIDPGGASHWWRTMNRDLFWLGGVLTLTTALAAVLMRESAFYISVSTAFAALTLLHGNSNRFSGDAVRALADFALLAPIPVMVIMRCGDSIASFGR